MQEKGHVYKCESCETIVTVIKEGDGQLNCCEHDMKEVTPDDAKRLTYGMQRPGSP